MPLSTSEVGERFFAGKKSGRAKNIKIVHRDPFTLLVDFDWAVLAQRNKKTGGVTYFSGWDRYSRSTTRHISHTGLRDSYDNIDDSAPQLSEYQEIDPIEQFHKKYADISIDPFTHKPRLIRRK